MSLAGLFIFMNLTQRDHIRIALVIRKLRAGRTLSGDEQRLLADAAQAYLDGLEVRPAADDKPDPRRTKPL